MPTTLFSRRGFALLVVIAVLLILSLLGVAFLITAHTDRFSSSANARNTQADLLLDGAAAMTRAAISSEQPGIAHPSVDGLARDRVVSEQVGTLVASRVPVRLSQPAPAWQVDSTQVGSQGAATYFQGDIVSLNGSMWVCRKTHVASTAAAPPLATYWLDTHWAANTPVWPHTSRLSTFEPAEDPARPTALPYTSRSIMRPNFIAWANRTYPALEFYDPISDQMQNVVAADTDGDGIADAPLTRMRTGKLGGIDYFYGVRVIDNAAAVNASTAWQPEDGADATRAGGLFPTDIDLRLLLRGGSDEMDRLNRFRFSNSAATIDLQASRIDDNGLSRTDFIFGSMSEALWMQLGRRLDNPWYTGAPTIAGAKPRFTSLAASDSGALAYGGGSLLNNQVPSSTIEQLLDESLYSSKGGQTPVPAVPYTADAAGVTRWFDNFDYQSEVADDPSTWRARRALITTRNPVSDVAPTLDMAPLLAAGQPPVASTSGEAGKMPVSRTPPVASANAAAFEELWRTFWNVMAEDWSSAKTPFGDAYAWAIAHGAPGMLDDPYYGTHFTAGSFAPIAQQHPARMFRSPLRAVPASPTSSFDAKTPRLLPDQVLLLRSALASVNTLSLRSNDDLIASQDVHLSAVVGGTTRPVTARVFGIKPQPFITEIYVQADTVSSSPSDVTITNPFGYIAIEIHNPYPSPIDLTNCRLGILDRSGTASSLALIDLSQQAPLSVSLSTATSNLADYDSPAIGPTIVPAHGYLVLENYQALDQADPNRDPRAAGFRPASSGLPLTGAISSGRLPNANFAFVRNLDLVLNKELVLLRPLGAARVTQRIHSVDYDAINAPQVVRYSGSEQAIDMAPLDAFDFTGMALPASGSTSCFAWHYARASHRPTVAGDVNKAWHFVYPGRYDGSQRSSADRPAPRAQGTQAASWTAGSQSDPWAASPPSPGVSLGSDGGSSTSGLNFNATFPTEFAVRVCDVTWAGPNAPTGPTGNRFPFGGFSRRADLLEITFVGGYRLQLDEQVATSQLLELNPLTTDSVFAEDTDTADDAPANPREREQIGRFCPTGADLATAAEGEATSVGNDTLTDPARTEPAGYWNGYQLLLYGGPGPDQVHTVVSSDPTGVLHVVPALNAGASPGRRYRLHQNNYAWSARLFQYLDVLAPSGDYLPNTSPASYGYVSPVDGQRHPIAPAPVAVRHTSRTPPGSGLAIEGQININTAPAKVLASVPFFEASTGENTGLAQAIVAWREIRGPFRSLFDLYRVPAFVDANRQAVADAGRVIPSDFEQRFFLLNRVSNVLTTRSDSFTCYVTVQGWEGLGTASPQLVERRHCAFEVDRSGMWTLPPEISTRAFISP